MTIKCMSVQNNGKDCNRPAKGRLSGNIPACGVHLRAAEANGEEIRPLTTC